MSNDLHGRKKSRAKWIGNTRCDAPPAHETRPQAAHVVSSKFTQRRIAEMVAKINALEAQK